MKDDLKDGPTSLDKAAHEWSYSQRTSTLCEQEHEKACSALRVAQTAYVEAKAARDNAMTRTIETAKASDEARALSNKAAIEWAAIAGLEGKS